MVLLPPFLLPPTTYYVLLNIFYLLFDIFHQNEVFSARISGIIRPVLMYPRQTLLGHTRGTREGDVGAKSRRVHEVSLMCDRTFRSNAAR